MSDKGPTAETPAQGAAAEESKIHLRPEDVGLSSKRESFKTGSRFKRGSNNNTKNRGTRQRLKSKMELQQALWGDAARGDIESIKGCIEAGVDIDAIDHSDADHRAHCSALMRAAGAGQVMAMATLMKLGASVTLTNKRGWSALTVAAIKGRADAAGILISKGADVNQRTIGPDDVAGFTALMWAALGGHTEAAESLLKRGADPNLVNALGKSACDIALDEEHSDVLALLTQAVEPQPLLWIGARKGDTELLRKALDGGASMDQIDNRSDDYKHQLSALLMTAKEGHQEAMELLLERGASVTPEGSSFTALHMAAQSGELEAVKILLDGDKCTVDELDSDHNTALHHAATTWAPAKRPTIEYLLSKGSDIAAVNKDGLTASGAARAQKYSKIADWMDTL